MDFYPVFHHSVLRVRVVVVACLDASESKYAAELVPHAFGLFDLERASFYFSSAAVIVEELLLALEYHARVRRESPLAVAVAITSALEIAPATIRVRVGFVGARVVVLLELEAVGARGGVACRSVFVPLHRLVIVVFHEQVLLILVSASAFFVGSTVI